MNDLKLYARSNEKLQQVIHMTKESPNNIHMEFGLIKCRTLHLIRGESETAEFENGNEDHICLRYKTQIVPE